MNIMIARVFKLIWPGLLMLFLLTGCLKNDWEEREKEEADKLEKYIENLRSQGLNIETREVSGYNMYYLLLGSDPEQGLTPQMNDYVIIDYIRRDLDGNVLFTNVGSQADNWSAYNNYPETYSLYLFEPLKMIFGYNTPGFNYGMSLMEEGDTAKFFVPSTLAYVDFVTIVDEIILYRIITSITAYDSLQVAGYRAENGIDSSMYLADAGIFYRETMTGNDTTEISTNDSLIIRFKASYLQENNLIVFDSNWQSATGITIPASKIKAEGYIPPGFTPVTKGFAAAIDTFAVGTQATMVVPYQKGYGTSGLSYSAPQYPIVPPYSSLVYEVEVLGIK
jgi:FKBP-type peptidyl-prolyl cis-trans isomerase